MQCKQCGCELNEDAQFCTRCGTRMQGGTPEAGDGPAGYGQAGYAQSYGAWQAAPAGAASSVASAYLIPKEEMQRRRVAGNLQPLGITWCIWGVIRLVTGLIAGAAVHTLSREGIWTGSENAFLPSILQVLVPVLAVSNAAMSALALVTGYALLTGKPWARTLAIIAAILNLLKIPLGTTLGIYTLWVLAPRAAGLEYERITRRGVGVA